MAIEWSQAGPEVLKVAERVIRDHHTNLLEAKIGFLMRSEDGASNGKRVIGKAAKFPVKLRPYVELDFLIWLSRPTWLELDVAGREALVDHELCHLEYDPDTLEAGLKAHDVEEFVEIIERHGLWRFDLERTAEAIQPFLPELEAKRSEHRGSVVAVDPGLVESVTVAANGESVTVSGEQFDRIARELEADAA